MHHGTASAGTGVARRSRKGGRVSVVVALGAAAAIALAACGGSSSSSSSKKTTTTKSSTAAAPAVVKTASSSLGTIVVTQDGKTVYTLTNAGQQVPCTGACLQAWPPVMATGGKATGTGVQNVGTTSSGQVTVNGAPVYTFAGDAMAGNTNGQGVMSFGGTWNVVMASGGGATATTAPATSAKSSSGY